MGFLYFLGSFNYVFILSMLKVAELTVVSTFKFEVGGDMSCSSRGTKGWFLGSMTQLGLLCTLKIKIWQDFVFILYILYTKHT